jgi:hypothetical protein
MREFPHMLFHWEFDLSMAFGLLAPISCLELCSPFLDCCSKIKKYCYYYLHIWDIFLDVIMMEMFQCIQYCSMHSWESKLKDIYDESRINVHVP